VNADDVVLRDNDITNHHTAICVSLGSAVDWGRAHDTLVRAIGSTTAARSPPRTWTTGSTSTPPTTP
jgi:hypothetical protein